MAIFKNKPLLDSFLDSSHNVNRTEPDYSPIDENQINYDYDIINVPTMLRDKGKYWGNKKTSLLDMTNAGIKTFQHRAATDVERIGKFMISPRGLLWNTKQFGLYLMNPKAEKRLELGFNQKRLFNPIKFISNVAGKSIGLHKENHGLLGDGDYAEISKFNNDIVTYQKFNRLIKIYKEMGYDQQDKLAGISKIGSRFQETAAAQKIGGITKTTSGVSGLLDKIPQNKFISGILNYNNKVINTISGINGVKSLYGLGRTLIRGAKADNPALPKMDSGKRIYVEDEESKNYSLYDTFYIAQGKQPGFYGGGGNSMTVLSMYGYNVYQSLDEASNEKWKTWNNFESQKYWNRRKDHFKSLTIYADQYDNDKSYNANWNYYKRLGIPEANKKQVDVIYGDTSQGINSNNASEDFVKLRIGGIQFRCTIEGFNHNFNPNWSSTKYIGRPDEVKNYEGVNRSISFSFIVAAQSAKEMQGIYLKLNQLAQMVSPDISEGGLMTGRVVDLKLGSWTATNATKGMPTVITSLSFSIDPNHPWDILKELPMIVKVDISFDIIGNKIPSSQTRYIAHVSWDDPSGKTIADDEVKEVWEPDLTFEEEE